MSSAAAPSDGSSGHRTRAADAAEAPASAAAGARWAWVAVFCWVPAIALQVLVAALGPSVALPPVRPELDRGRPADPELVTALLAVALVLGVAAVAAGLAALRAGWRPAPRRLLAAALLGVVVLLLGPPLGTADTGGYAAYGRMAVLDLDPYATTPRDLAGDPVADAAEEPWRDIRSIYGPLAATEFRLAAELGGDSREAVLRLLQLASGLAFVATAVALDRVVARRGDAARRRAAVLWATNPLLLHQLVAGAHLDALLALLVVVGVVLAARVAPATRGGPAAARSLSATVAAGAVFGLAGLVKATAAAPAAALVLADVARARRLPARRAREVFARIAAFVAAGLVVVAGGYALVGGLSALEPTREAGRMVSRATPGRWVASALEQVLPDDAARSVTALLAVVLAVALAVRLVRVLPTGTALQDGVLLRAALAGSAAWVVLAPYSLPWYDAVVWALLALLVVGTATEGRLVGRLETILLVHTGFLSVAYLPGRVVGLPDGIATAQDVVRGLLGPLVVLAVAVALARLPAADAGGPGPSGARSGSPRRRLRAGPGGRRPRRTPAGPAARTARSDRSP